MPVMLAPLVAVAAVLAWALGVPGRRAAAAGGVALALLVVSTVVLLGAISLTEDGDAPEGGEGVTSAEVGMRAVDVVLAAQGGRVAFPVPPASITGLRDGDVRLVEVEVDVDRSVLAAQCVAGSRRCAPGIPVQPDDQGSARTLVAFARTLQLAEGDVDCAKVGCNLVLADDEVLFAVPLVFGPPLPTPTLTVADRSGVRAGQELLVVLTGFPEGTATVTVCAPPGPVDPSACGAPAPELVVEVPATGEATVRYPVATGRVGSGGARCRRGDPCAVAVPGVAALPVELSFAGLSDAEPSRRRAAAGLAAAGAMLLAAVWIARRTDWAPVEGDPFDGVVLTDPFDEIDLSVPDEAECAIERS